MKKEEILKILEEMIPRRDGMICPKCRITWGVTNKIFCSYCKETLILITEDLETRVRVDTVKETIFKLNKRCEEKNEIL